MGLARVDRPEESDTMRLLYPFTISLCVLSLSLPSFASHVRRGPTSPRVSSRRAAKTKPTGQRGIDDARATELQQALIKAGYLSGEPSGHWDAATEAAMAKLQADNGWQTKLVPDSRAIIKLGLGPSATSPADQSAGALDQTGYVDTRSGMLASR